MSSKSVFDDGLRRRLEMTSHGDKTSEYVYAEPEQNEKGDRVIEEVGITKTESHETDGKMVDSIQEKNDSILKEVPQLQVPQVPPKSKSRSSTYASTKTVAQGFLNMSLLSANAGQLKNVLLHGPSGDFYYMLLFMIITSMLLQLSVSVLLALKYFIDFDDDGIDEEEKNSAIKYNNISTVAVMVITALNVIISVFIG